MIAGADIRSVRMTPGVDFIAELERAIRELIPKPKMLVIGFPSNPTAHCVDLAFFERVIALAREHDILVVHDLAYADIVFDSYKAPSIMQVPGARDVAVEFFTMSKSYNMAGWRIGFMVGNQDLVHALARIKSYHDYGSFTPVQVASIVALEGPQECVEEVRSTYEKRRNVMVKALHDIGWMVEKPKASMYVWAKIPEFYAKLGSIEVTKRLLAQAKIAVARAKDVDIVIELIGGYTVAKDLQLEAIRHGKHVVTANKALLATHGNEIFAAAQKKGVMVAFEAAVAGGVPIIKALREGLTANRIEWIAGIINGTSNFILSEMREKGLTFDAALKDAQQRGYAEADPTFDIEGIDAAHKLTILSAIAFGIPMQFKRAYTEGIAKLTQQDIRYAEELGYRIKLLGITKKTKKGIELRVHPTLVPTRRLIANVEGVMNAILVNGDAVGPTLYYGAGAGSQPTASAVGADLGDVTRLITADPGHRVPHLAFQPDQLSDTPVLPIGDVETSYYLRMRVADKPGVLADITRILADCRISIDAMVQKEPPAGQREVDIVILPNRQ